MITRLTPLIYLFTPLGKAEAHFFWNSDSFEVSASYGCFIVRDPGKLVVAEHAGPALRVDHG